MTRRASPFSFLPSFSFREAAALLEIHLPPRRVGEPQRKKVASASASFKPSCSTSSTEGEVGQRVPGYVRFSDRVVAGRSRIPAASGSLWSLREGKRWRPAKLAHFAHGRQTSSTARAGVTWVLVTGVRPFCCPNSSVRPSVGPSPPPPPHTGAARSARAEKWRQEGGQVPLCGRPEAGTSASNGWAGQLSINLRDAASR